MKYVLGLDIGVASVGWGIIELDTTTPVKYGVRLFKEADAENNAKRRGFRRDRRLKRRRVNRIDDLKKILVKEQLLTSTFKYASNPYELRVKGLIEKLTRDELCTILLHLAKHRGNSLEIVEDDAAKIKDNETQKKILNENNHLLSQGKYVCEIQLARLNERGYIHGEDNNFRTSDYVKELNQILSNQELSKEVCEEIINCIIRRRQYFEGPGSKKSPSEYGRFIEKDGEIVEIDLIEKMTGKCSIFKDELRAPKMSYSAELYNFLNDLNNLTIDGDRKITTDEKDDILEVIHKKGNITPKQLAKLLNVSLEQIQGFRIDKKAEPLLTEFKGYKKFLKCLNSTQPELLENKKLLDQISVILTQIKGIEERQEKIQALDEKITHSAVCELANLSGFTGNHSLSLKAIYMMNEELYYSEMNQMQILHTSNQFEFARENTKGQKKIYPNNEAILSPVAKQAIHEAFKVINQLRNEYGEFDSIVIETTRAKNSADAVAKIKESQKYYESVNKKIAVVVGEENKLNGKLKEKIRLYLDQDGKCAYSLEKIDFETLIRDNTAYEVDHIIPLSVSLDDSYNNKVLVTHKANQDKGNLTPIMAFNSHRFKNSFEVYKANVLHLKSTKAISNKKCAYLLYDKDITRFDVMKDFINRNLVDTSYANRVILNSLQNYFKDNAIPTKVFTVKGSATQQFRKKIKLDKDREENYGHHAIDALIIASLMRQKSMFNALNNIDIHDGMIEVKDTGELVDIISDEEYFDSQYIAFIQKLHKLEVTRFSHKIDRKPNRKISDDTIYSTRQTSDGEKVVKKYKDIYQEKWTTLADDIMNGNVEKYLMYKHDPQTFTKFVEIVQFYYNEFKDDSKKIGDKNGKIQFNFNPLAEYYKENGKVTKYAKKNNGPEISTLKYAENSLGNHIDITSKYDQAGNTPKNKKVVLLQISPYRTDFYKCADGVYRFVTVRYSNIKYSKSKDKYCIEKQWYEKEKAKKKITSNDEFLFSMHRNELIELTDDKGTFLYKFTATNNDSRNSVEVKPINYYEKKQMMLTIGKKLTKVRKLSTDAIGNLYEVKKEHLKLEF